MGKVEFLQDWYRQVWTEGDISAVDRYFAPRSVANGLTADGQVKAEDFKALVPALRSLVHNIEVTIDRSIEAGDWLWAQITVRAVPNAGLGQVSATGQVMMLVEDGVIVEAYNAFDFITFFEQVGALPQDAFILMLSGERFA